MSVPILGGSGRQPKMFLARQVAVALAGARADDDTERTTVGLELTGRWSHPNGALTNETIRVLLNDADQARTVGQHVVSMSRAAAAGVELGEHLSVPAAALVTVLQYLIDDGPVIPLGMYAEAEDTLRALLGLPLRDWADPAGAEAIGDAQAEPTGG